MSDATPKISEAASRRPKRGRPNALGPTIMELVRTLHPNVSKRRQLDLGYAMLAMSAIGEDPACRWVVDREVMLKAGGGGGDGAWHGCKLRVLIQLGRLPLDTMKETAREVCAIPGVTVEKALEFLGRAPGPKPGAVLRITVSGTEASWRLEHAGIDRDELADILRDAADSLGVDA
jgi:hypothetical protein